MDTEKTTNSAAEPDNKPTVDKMTDVVADAAGGTRQDCG
jgi:hypothetical protein